jgi:putative ABC transport system substrate-binding protein
MIKKTLIIFLFVLTGHIRANALANDSTDIAIVAWRGITDAEKGFMQAFNNHPIRFTIYNCNKNSDSLMTIRRILHAKPPSLIYCFGTTVTLAMAGKYSEINRKEYLTGTPIVYTVVADPYGASLLKAGSNKSNRNLTGVSHLVPIDIQINTIRSVLPVKSMGVIFNRDEPNSLLQIKELSSLSITDSIIVISIGLSLTGKGIIAKKELLRAVDQLITSKIDIFYLLSDSYIISSATTLIPLFHNASIPTFSATEEPIRQAQAFMGLVSRYNAVGAYAALKAQEILKGRDPGDIPCENIPKFSLLFNMDACRKLDIYPPVTMLRFAELIKKGK